MAFSNTASLISTSSAVVCFTLAALLIFDVTAPAEARKHLHKMTIYMHGAINVTDFVVLPGVAGLGNAALTAKAGPFGSMFVFNEPITTDPDPASEYIGTMKGTGVTTTFQGTTFFISATASLNTTKYKGTFTQTGLSGGKIPIVGGTDDFQGVEGYTLSSYYSIHGFNIVYKVEVYLNWK